MAAETEFVKASGTLESAVVGSGDASGFSGGSIPDRVVGAPLKQPDRGLLVRHHAPIPDRVVGAPLKRRDDG